MTEEKDKKDYEKPELNGLGDKNGKLSNEDLKNVSGGSEWSCHGGSGASGCNNGGTPFNVNMSKGGNKCSFGLFAATACHSGESAGRCFTGSAASR